MNIWRSRGEARGRLALALQRAAQLHDLRAAVEAACIGQQIGDLDLEDRRALGAGGRRRRKKVFVGFEQLVLHGLLERSGDVARVVGLLQLDALGGGAIGDSGHDHAVARSGFRRRGLGRRRLARAAGGEQCGSAHGKGKPRGNARGERVAGHR
jgi:hypothetical protein